MRDAGSGLGAAGFVFLDDRDDLAAVAQGIARFLAVESCGQCTPCKRDGLALAGLLDRIRRSEARAVDLDAVADRVSTVADSARCALARQQQDVIGSVLERFPEVAARPRRTPGSRGRSVSRRADRRDRPTVGRCSTSTHSTKQPDWTYDEIDSGKWPAQRIDERRAESHED